MDEPRTDQATDVMDLTQLTRAFFEEERRGPEVAAKFFERVLAADLCYRRADAVMGKAAFIQGLQDVGPGDTQELTSEIREVGVAGDWGFVEEMVTFKGIRGGRRIDGQFQNLRVFERTEDGWSCLVWFNRPYESRQ